MTTPSTTEILRATAQDVPRLSATLARAFHADPVFRWIVPDDDVRRARLPAVFHAFADAHVAHEQTYLTRDGAGGAMWAPAGTDPLAERAEDVGERIGAALAGDAERAFLLTELLEQEHPTDPCLHLQFLGVVPERQGRGVGSRLLAEVLEPADATATPAHLDATSPDNRRLYERHGFAVTSEVALPAGPPVWSMWRDPRPPADRR